jgi:hypothetical protein
MAALLSDFHVYTNDISEGQDRGQGSRTGVSVLSSISGLNNFALSGH